MNRAGRRLHHWAVHSASFDVVRRRRSRVSRSSAAWGRTIRPLAFLLSDLGSGIPVSGTRESVKVAYMELLHQPMIQFTAEPGLCVY